MKCHSLLRWVVADLATRGRLLTLAGNWTMPKRQLGNRRKLFGRQKAAVSRDNERNFGTEPAEKKRRNMETNNEERLSATHNVPVERLESPIKSESDKKEYRVIRLPNGLRALLVSDLTGDNLDAEIYNEENATEYEESDKESEKRTIQSTDEDSEESSDEDGTDCECSSDEDEMSEDKKHDPNSEKMAACALTIGVGSFSNPPKIPGLAHFLEHMVFMGSKKYPKENELEAYLQKKGGHDNAWTECETTTFYLEIHEKYLVGSLDRFSQFFISPLMQRDAIERERKAVDSEFQISRSDDETRKEQLISDFAREGNPVRIFQWGNEVSLKDNVSEDELYEELHKFRERHYSGHRMTLAVQARLSLDVLEDLVVKYFTEIPSNDLPPNDFSPYIEPESFDSSSFHKIVKMKSVKDVKKLEFTWVLPPILHLYRFKPLDYITSIMGYEGRGSLISYLRKKKWCIELVCGNDESGFQSNSMYAFYILVLSVTDEGYNHIEEICDEVFSYINMLKQVGPQKRIYDELEKIEKMSFRFEKEQSAVDNVELLSESMHYFEPKDYIRGSCLYFEYNPEEIRRCLDAITPTKVNITIQKKSFENECWVRKEPWFGTEYQVEDIPERWVERWKTIAPRPEYHLPEPNMFIAEDFSMVPLPECVPKYPTKIYGDEKLDVWFRMDPKFRLPDACIRVKLVTPLLCKSIENCVMGDLYVKVLTLLLIEDIYHSTTAKLDYKVTPTRRGLRFDFYGFNEKIPLLLKTVMEYVAKFCSLVKEDYFSIIKERELRLYYNHFLKPKNLTKDSRLKIILQAGWSTVEKHAAVQKISYEQFLQFCQELTRELHVKFHAQGNMTGKSVICLAKQCVELLDFAPLPRERHPEIRVFKIPPGESYFKVRNMDKTDTNSIVMNYYQSEYRRVKDIVIADLLTLIMEEPLFNQLRTQEQLGYIVSCTPLDTYGVHGFLVNVNTQANKFSTETVDDRIENFILSFKEELRNMSEEEFGSVKESLIKLKRNADNELQEEFRRNWEEIESDKLIFDRREQDVRTIEGITLQELRDWFDEHTKGGAKYKKLSLHTIGTSVEVPTDDSETSKGDEDCKSNYTLQYVAPTEEERQKHPDANFITCINEFKENLELFQAGVNPYEKTCLDEQICE